MIINIKLVCHIIEETAAKNVQQKHGIAFVNIEFHV